MARQPRLELSDGHFHITARGVDGAPIAFDERDLAVLQRILHRAVRRAGWRCLRYCFMTNHFHLLLLTPKPTLGRGMQLLNGTYAAYVNERWGRTGHLFGGRFGSRFIENDAHLLEACRYIDLNPVKAGLCKNPEDWKWSSYAATTGLAAPAPFLDPYLPLGLFDADRVEAQRAYRAFVEEGRGR